MLVKCPKCHSLVEGSPGMPARCKECGYEARVPAAATAADPKGTETVQVNQIAPTALMGPFGLMTGVAGLATFYLSPYIFPFLFSGAAAAMGFIGLRKGGDRLTVAALSLGSVGLVLEILALALAS